MKDRITSWGSTVPGVVVVLAVCFLAWLEPQVRNPAVLVPLAGGLYAIFGLGKEK